jgi:hypothetical protein
MKIKFVLIEIAFKILYEYRVWYAIFFHGSICMTSQQG